MRELPPAAVRALRVLPMIKRFLRDETGLELSEYAVAAALVVVVAAGVFAALGVSITDKIDELSGHIKTGK